LLKIRVAKQLRPFPLCGWKINSGQQLQSFYSNWGRAYKNNKKEKQANEKISSRRLKLCGAAMDWELGGKTTEKRKNKQQQQEF